MRPSVSKVSSSSGFSLLEVLIALALLTVTALTLADVLVRAVTTAERTRRGTVAAALAVERLEQLRALAWGVGDGAAGPAADTHTDLSGGSPATGGAGLSSAPADTLTRNTPGYVDFADAAGRWVARDLPPPRGALFVRRWSVDDAPFAAGTLALRVVVGVVVPTRPDDMATDPAPAFLATVKARKAG